MASNSALLQSWSRVLRVHHMLDYPSDFFKQHFADLSMYLNMPSHQGGLLQTECPLHTEFSEVFLHLGLIEHTLDDFTGRLECLAVVIHNLGRHSSPRGEMFETPEKGKSK